MTPIQVRAWCAVFVAWSEANPCRNQPLLRLPRIALEIDSVLRILHAHVEGDAPRDGKPDTDLASDEVSWPGIAGTGKGRASEQAQVGYGPVFEGPEEDMPDRAADRGAFGKIQNIDEVVPARIQIEGVLIRRKGRRVVAVVLVHRADFDVSIAKRRDPGLDANHAILGREGPLAEGDIKVEGPDREPFEQRVLRQGRRRKRIGHQAETDDREGEQELMGPTGLRWASVWHVVWRE